MNAADDRKRGGLKLKARDSRDLDVIAALLQDALVPLSDVAFLRGEKRFVLVANRFKWAEAEGKPDPGPERDEANAEKAGDEGDESDAAFEDSAGAPPFERVNCGVCFEQVMRVRSKNIDLNDRRQILNLLTIVQRPGSVTLLFSDDAAIRLEVSALSCHIEDLGDAWPTRWRPHHEDAVERSGSE
jgi:hypothetical protein